MYERHGHSTNKQRATPTYRVWSNMKMRCTNPKNPSYRFYGARGIGVCERWLTFVNFLADMGERPNGLELDRIDNARGYEPGNCRWVTRLENMQNTPRATSLTFAGETLSIAAWAKRLGIDRMSLLWRLRAWSLERALTTRRKSYGIR